VAITQGCASIGIQPFSSPNFTKEEVKEILEDFRRQDSKVTSFFASGRMLIEDIDGSTEVLSLVVGKKEPVEIKVELTHPWGRPLLHVLIKGEEVHVLSFAEKKYFTGAINDLEVARILPGSGGKINYLWGLLRGFPVVPDFQKAVPLQGRKISLLDEEGKKAQIIQFNPKTDLPSAIFFPEHWTKMLFSDFAISQGIKYSKKIEARDQKTDRGIRMEIEKMTFNKTIPEAIFELNIPPGFK
jgi:hypothetical protein